jgi:hypothetical protein
MGRYLIVKFIYDYKTALSRQSRVKEQCGFKKNTSNSNNTKEKQNQSIQPICLYSQKSHLWHRKTTK